MLGPDLALARGPLEGDAAVLGNVRREILRPHERGPPDVDGADTVDDQQGLAPAAMAYAGDVFSAHERFRFHCCSICFVRSFAWVQPGLRAYRPPIATGATVPASVASVVI